MTGPNITEWLENRLREDEDLARSAFKDYGDGDPSNGPEWSEIWSGTVECGPGGEHIACFDSGLSRHIARHDPARVLRGVAAKRALLDDITAEKHRVIDDPWYTCPAATEDRDGGYYAETDGSGPCDCGRDERVERRLRTLAAVYPDCPEGWKP